MRQLLFIIGFVFILFSANSFSQNIGVGASAIYNFQTESFGVGARVSVFPNNRLSFVPQASYYFGFNKVEEYLVGLGLEYKFIYRKKFHIYALAHGAYNSWLNYQASDKNGAQKNNWNGEVGLGISTNTCLRPFLEYRYNFKFFETHLQLGVLYIFGCKSKKKNAFDRCAAYGF